MPITPEQLAAMKAKLLVRVWDGMPRLALAFPEVEWDGLSDADYEHNLLDILALLDGLNAIAGCSRCPDPSRCKEGRGVPSKVIARRIDKGPLHLRIFSGPCPRRADLTREWAQREHVRGYRVRYPEP